MDPIIVIVIAGAAGAAVIAVLSATARHRRTDTVAALDPDAAEHWLIRHAPRRLRRLMRVVDRRVVGGAVVAVGFVVALVAALFVGWILDTIDQERGFAQWDSAAAEWGARNATDTTTTVLKAVTDLGGTLYLALVAAAVAGFDYWRRRNANSVIFLTLVLGGVVLINNGVKLLVDRERPAIAPLVGSFGASFPSGHSAAAAAGWAAIALVLSRHAIHPVRIAAGAAAATVAAAVAASRVLLGVHWLSDVIAGAVLGWAWFVVVSLAFGGRLVRLGEPADRVAATSPAPLEPTPRTDPLTVETR